MATDALPAPSPGRPPPARQARAAPAPRAGWPRRQPRLALAGLVGLALAAGGGLWGLQRRHAERLAEASHAIGEGLAALALGGGDRAADPAAAAAAFARAAGLHEEGEVGLLAQLLAAHARARAGGAGGAEALTGPAGEGAVGPVVVGDLVGQLARLARAEAAEAAGDVALAERLRAPLADADGAELAGWALLARARLAHQDARWDDARAAYATLAQRDPALAAAPWVVRCQAELAAAAPPMAAAGSGR